MNFLQFFKILVLSKREAWKIIFFKAKRKTNMMKIINLKALDIC